MKQNNLLTKTLLLLALIVGSINVWGDSFTVSSSTTSSDALFPVTESLTQYDYNSRWTSYNLIKMNQSESITITNVTGATITAISAEGVADNNSNKTVNFTISDGITSAQTSSGSWNNRKDSETLTSKAFNASNVAKLKMTPGQTYTITNNSSSSYNAGVRFVITYTPAAATAHTVTFSAGNHGSCGTTSLTEASAGAGVTLPAVTANTGYTFNGWYTASRGGTKAGDAGNTYKPNTDITLYAQYTATAITYNLNVGTSAGTTIMSSTVATGTNNDKISDIEIDQTNSGANGDGASDRTTKLLIMTGANGETFEDPTYYVLFKFTVADGYQFTLDDATIKIANVGSASANNIKYKAVLSDGNESTGTTYVCTTQSGEVETFYLSNEGNKSFTGKVTLKLWAWTIADKTNGGTAFRMGTPLTISGIVRPEEVSITPAKDYTTYVTPYAMDFTGVSNLTAYVATSKSGSNVVMTPVEEVPENTPLLLKRTTASTFNVPVIASASDVATNYLKVAPAGGKTFTGKETDKYILYDGTFYLVNAGTLDAGKVYLDLEGVVGAHTLDIIFEESGEATGIAEVANKKAFNGEFYNLAGQKVAQPTKGLYIVNGKKVVLP